MKNDLVDLVRIGLSGQVATHLNSLASDIFPFLPTLAGASPLLALRQEGQISVLISYYEHYLSNTTYFLQKYSFVLVRKLRLSTTPVLRELNGSREGADVFFVVVYIKILAVVCSWQLDGCEKTRRLTDHNKLNNRMT